MTFLDEMELFSIGSTRGAEDRANSLFRSYLFARFNCQFVELKSEAFGKTIYFRDRHENLHSLPLIVFRTGQYARTLIQNKLDVAEVEFRLKQERVMA